MRIPQSALPNIRLGVLIVFVATCAVVFSYLWVNSGGQLPPITNDGYRVAIDLPKASNLVKDSDVRIAGVRVGKVADLRGDGDHAHVVMQLDQAAPLHQGAMVQVREKTLVEETFLDLTDGSGPALASGTSLPTAAGKPATQLNDVLLSLDSNTRGALAESIRSLGAGTAGSQHDISQTLSGLGDVGRQGHDAIDALAAQSNDLEQLTRNTGVLLAALNTRQGEIAQMVSNADQLTSATADNRAALEAVLRQAPGLLTTTRNATGSVQDLSAALQPLAKNLRTAAPDLSAALSELPQTSADLRGLLPALDGVLNEAPATLARVPVVSRDAQQLIPNVQVALGDVNPMLSYVKPYGHDIAGFFSNFGAAMDTQDSQGKLLHLFAVFNEQSMSNSPANTNIGPLNRNNPYPAPGQGAHPGPSSGPYPRIQGEAPPK